MLVVLGGLPRVGKSTIARALARATGAAWLRVDVIEQAMREAGLAPGPAGYLVGDALARSNLEVGRTVIADSVNPLEITRAAWRAAGGGRRAVEIICSDAAAHRARVEGRAADVDGLRLPTWAEVLSREYEPWGRERLVIDAALASPGEAVARLAAHMGGDGIEPPANSV